VQKGDCVCPGQGALGKRPLQQREKYAVVQNSPAQCNPPQHGSLQASSPVHSRDVGLQLGRQRVEAGEAGPEGVAGRVELRQVDPAHYVHHLRMHAPQVHHKYITGTPQYTRSTQTKGSMFQCLMLSAEIYPSLHALVLHLSELHERGMPRGRGVREAWRAGGAPPGGSGRTLRRRCRGPGGCREGCGLQSSGALLKGSFLLSTYRTVSYDVYPTPTPCSMGYSDTRLCISTYRTVSYDVYPNQPPALRDTVTQYYAFLSSAPCRTTCTPPTPLHHGIQ